MTYLALSVLCSTLILLVFKAFTSFKVNTFQAIVVNYWVCVISGVISYGKLPFELNQLNSTWAYWAIFLGCFFIGGFYVIGKTVQHFGITLTTVLQKMSLILSVPFAILMYQEEFGWLKACGLFLALPAIWLTNAKNEKVKTKKINPILAWLPFITWLTSGIIEIILQWVQTKHLTNIPFDAFAVLIFGVAGIIGTIILIYQLAAGKTKINSQSVLGGIMLGIPNYGSILFLLLALDSNLGGSVIYPINNVSIIVLSAILAYLIFKEKFNSKNIFGVILSVIAIILIAFA